MASKGVLKARVKEQERLQNIEKCATDLLNRIDDMTSKEFELGGERVQREALRKALGLK